MRLCEHIDREPLAETEADPTDSDCVPVSEPVLRERDSNDAVVVRDDALEDCECVALKVVDTDNRDIDAVGVFVLADLVAVPRDKLLDGELVDDPSNFDTECSDMVFVSVADSEKTESRRRTVANSAAGFIGLSFCRNIAKKKEFDAGTAVRCLSTPRPTSSLGRTVKHGEQM